MQNNHSVDEILKLKNELTVDLRRLINAFQEATNLYPDVTITTNIIEQGCATIIEATDIKVTIKL